MRIILSHKEAFVLKGIIDRISTSEVVQISFKLTDTIIDVDSQFTAALLLALKKLSKEWEKEKKQ